MEVRSCFHSNHEASGRLAAQAETGVFTTRNFSALHQSWARPPSRAAAGNFPHRATVVAMTASRLPN